jgi:hypothetical protein
MRPAGGGGDDARREAGCLGVVDPFGHRWNIATRQEEVSPEEMRRRFKALYG